MTLTELATGYLEERVSRGELDPMTARNHRSALTRFCCSVGTKPVERLNVKDVERWLETRAHLRPTTRRSQFSYVLTFCAWLERHGHIHRNPAADLRPPRVPKSVPRALPAAYIAKLVGRAPDARGRAIVWLMVGMGLRCCEVSNLTLDDWDRHAEHMRIVGKGANERVIPVPQEVTEAVEDYLRHHPASLGPLIRSYREPEKSLTADTLSGMVSEWMRAAKIKRAARDGVSAHSLRHTCASDVLDREPDLRVVQQLLGHQHLTTTCIYLRRASMGKLREAMAGRSYSV